MHYGISIGNEQGKNAYYGRKEVEKVKGIPVIKDWVHALSWKEQTVLLAALRGCDGIKKDDASKAVTKSIRSLILYNAGPDGSAFMENKNYAGVGGFADIMDAYPFHFVSHIMDAAQIIGYCCPDKAGADVFGRLYKDMAYRLHMEPETEEHMHGRLSDYCEGTGDEKASRETDSYDYYRHMDSHPFTGERKVLFKAKLSEESWLDGYFNNAPDYSQVTGVTRGKVYEIHKVKGHDDVGDYYFINDNGKECHLGDFFFEKAE